MNVRNRAKMMRWKRSLLCAAAGCLWLVFPRTASANLIIQASEGFNGPITCSSVVNVNNSVGSGPISSPLAICGNITGTGSASYGSLGQTFSFSGGYQANTATAFTDTLQLSGAPSGTPLDLQFLFSYGGTYSYSGLGYATLLITSQVFLPNQATFLLNDSEATYFCATAGAASGCPYPSPVLGASGSGSINRSLTSSTELLAPGTTQIPVNVEFSIGVVESPSANFSADFLDPFTLSNILVTNGNTGQMISGVTITGGSGATYPTNVQSAVPEPGASALVIVGALGCFLFRKKLLGFGENSYRSN